MSISLCAEQVAQGDPLRFRALMTMPLPIREKLFPLIALNLEIARAAYVTSEPMIAQIRLEWWRARLQEIYDGETPEPHAVLTPLFSLFHAAFSDFTEAKALSDALIDARYDDINGLKFADWPDLFRYLDQTGGALMALCDLALGARARNPRDFGAAAATAGYLVAAPQLLKRNMQVFPREDLSPLIEWGEGKYGAARAPQPLFRLGYQTKYILARAAKDQNAVRRGDLSPAPLRDAFLLMESFFKGRSARA